MKRLVLPISLVLVAVAPGCVTKAKYTELQGQLDASQREPAGAGARVGELEAQVADLQRTIADLEGKIAAAEAEHARLGEQLAKADADMATLLKDRSRLKESIAEMTQALADQRKRRAEAERRIAEYRDMLLRFKGLIEAGKLNVKIVDGRMVLALPMDILFDTGKAKLSDDGTAALTEVGAVLATIPDKEFQVEGHTDNVPIYNEKFPSNWELASARAMVVLKTLQAAGVAPTQLSAAAFGEFKPAADNGSDEGKAKNRRIEIVIVPDLSNLPGYDELNALA
ncbi:MAG: OmpA family protein, partial [Myxococcales bacterium]|nr:OmpA family protein [Myxococcales bacterium]